MIKRVLIISAIAFLIGLSIFWLVTGGLSATARTAKGLMNPVDFLFGGNASGTPFRLPGQPRSPTGPEIPGYDGDTGTEDSFAEDRAAIEAQYAPTIEMSHYDPRTFGNPSPYVGRVLFERENASESNSASEYVVLKNTDESPITMSGWSLQSAVSGIGATLPYGAEFFTLGVVNSLQPVSLKPGASAIITSGVSPVGTSFRENICSGYLDELRSFEPRLNTQCPSPYGALPITADNIKIYGDECIDYVNSLATCHFPSSVPATLPPACRSFITNTFSYNGCVQTHRNEASFSLSSWRLYLGRQTELWRNTHDVIRLLDEKGRVVDVLTY